MQITGTHIQYLHLCHRKLWLFANGINMEHNSDLVSEGRLVDEYTYADRSDKWRQLEIEGIKIDHYDPKKKVIREVKKSNKRESAHIAQVKHYMHVLRRNGIEVNLAILEYPLLRKTEEISYEISEEAEIILWEETAAQIIASEQCPSLIKKSLCKRCSYYDFCYADEIDEKN